MAKIDSRLIALPNDGEAVYVIQNGAYIPVNIIDMSDNWSPSIDNSNDIVLTIDEDMIPYQLTGTNSEVNVP